MFKVYQYDIEVAFIQSTIDPNHFPVYCAPAEGYEDRRQYVYQLHKHLYGMKDSPRGWSKLFSSVCLTYLRNQPFNPSVCCTLKRASASFPVTTVERMDVEPNPKKTTLKIPL